MIEMGAPALPTHRTNACLPSVNPPGFEANPPLTAWQNHIFTMYVSILITSVVISTVSALWPVPIHVSEGITTVILAEGFTIEFIGPNGRKPAGCVKSSHRVWGAIDRTYRLLYDGFVPNMLFPFEHDFEPSPQEMAASQQLKKLVITQTYLDPLSQR